MNLGNRYVASSLDSIWPPVIQSWIFCFPCEQSKKKSMFHVLTTGLARTIEQRPYLAGRLAFKDGRLQLTYRDLSRTTIPISINELTERPNDWRISCQYLRKQGMPISHLPPMTLEPAVCQDGLKSSPVVAQANFIAGGCLLTVCLNHGLGDGPPQSNLIETWARNCKDLEDNEGGLITANDDERMHPLSLAKKKEASKSIDRGVKYLEANEAKWDTPAFVCVEKVTYGSKILSETYCLAALQASSSHEWGEKASGLFEIPLTKISMFTHFFSKLPLFSQEPTWRLQASIIEGYMLAPLLHSSQSELQIFPSLDGGNVKYLDYIPFTWTMCNNATNFGLSTKILHEIMIISVINFQADKYLDDVTENDSLRGDFDSLRTIVHQLFQETPRQTSTNGHGHSNSHKDHVVHGDGKRRKLLNGNSQRVENDHKRESQDLDEPYPSEFLLGTEQVLSRFTTYILSHSKVSTAPKSLQRRAKEELLTFLLAHITHGQHNAQLSKLCPQDEIRIFTRSQTSYHGWVHTTSADNTSCPYSFEFFRCLVAPPGTNPFPNALVEYLAQDVCRHLAVMCRQYNDYSSIKRDRAENNLNSVNFPEFHNFDSSYHVEIHDEELTDKHNNVYTKSPSQPQSTRLEEALRKKLLDIAGYERECLDHAIGRLRREIAPETWKALEVFIKVTDLYGQIYVVRDINNNTEAE
ncbi:hypothetical protein AAE478_007520 [Parahypoxylon ruwenzoriense]